MNNTILVNGNTLMNFTQLDVETLDFDNLNFDSFNFDSMNFANKKRKPAFSFQSILSKIASRLGLQDRALEKTMRQLTNQKHNRSRVLAK